MSNGRVLALSAVLAGIAVAACSSSSSSGSGVPDSAFGPPGDGGHSTRDAKTSSSKDARTSSSKDAKTSSSKDATHPGDGGHASDTGRHDAPGAGEAGVCSTLSVEGSAIVGLTVKTGAAPVASGGAIPAGLYTLVERDFYAARNPDGPPDAGAPDAAPPGTTPFVQRLLSFTTTTLDIAEADGTSATGPLTAMPSSHYTWMTYGSSGSLLSTDEVCPGPGITHEPFSVLVVASGGTSPDGGPLPQLWLFPQTGSREVYAPVASSATPGG